MCECSSQIMWLSGARLEGTCRWTVKSVDWKESRDRSGGWLATGCSNGTVGISWISASAKKSQKEIKADDESERDGQLSKIPFTLRGHTGDVEIVEWMPVGMRLASYDTWGSLIVWENSSHIFMDSQFKINPTVKITDIQWSPCGSCLTACANTGKIMLYSSVTGASVFSVYVGSAATLLKGTHLTCCRWNQQGTRVAFGTSTGEVVLFDPETEGFLARPIEQFQDIPVQCIDWYGPITQCYEQTKRPGLSQSLSVFLRNGSILFQSPGYRGKIYKTSVTSGIAAWNSDKSVFVVIGRQKNRMFSLVAYLFNSEGDKVFTLKGFPQCKYVAHFSHLPLRNAVWALQDSVVLFSCGSHIYSLTVDHSLPSLESLCRYTIVSKLIGVESGVSSADLLPLPKHIIRQLTSRSLLDSY